jgi:MSHA biogenesis protein MshP
MRRIPTPRRSAGFALILALFLLVSLAAMGAYLFTISTGQLEAGIQDEQGARAYQAARAGVDWGAFQLLRNSGGAFATNCAGGSATQAPIALAAGLAGFYAEVSCQRVGSETEGAAAVRVFRITSTGCNRTPCAGVATPTYVERQLQLTLTN